MLTRSTLAAVAWMLAQAAGAATCATWPTEVYLLRHAEKQDSTSDSPLSPIGWQHADALPKALSGVAVGAILVSDKRRTQQTAAPLAKATGVDPQPFNQYASSGLEALVETLCEAGNQGAEAVVVVGHVSTVPKIMLEIGVVPGEEKRPAFGDLLVVEHDGSSVTVDHRRY